MILKTQCNSPIAFQVVLGAPRGYYDDGYSDLPTIAQLPRESQSFGGYGRGYGGYGGYGRGYGYGKRSAEPGYGYGRGYGHGYGRYYG